MFGETPNLAARLQSAAEPNQVVVASATRQLLGALFACSAIVAQEDYATLIEMNDEIQALARPARIDGVPDLSAAAVLLLQHAYSRLL